MFLILQIISVLLVALAAALPLAHALELPGKMRLEKSDYLVTQPIYYPGFTIAAGIGEGGGMLATLALLLMTPPRGAQFALTLAALIALVAMHVAYWLFTHPVNKFWLEGQPLKGFGAGFFAFDPLARRAPGRSDGDDWQRLRDRWEYSHVLRAALAAVSLVCSIAAVAL
jgi:hypothetical protein